MIQSLCRARNKRFSAVEVTKEKVEENEDYTILPDGTIIQYGFVDTGNTHSGSFKVKFPIPFKKKVKSVILSRHVPNSGAGNWYTQVVEYNSITLSGFSFGFNFGTVPNAFHYVAIGK